MKKSVNKNRKKLSKKNLIIGIVIIILILSIAYAAYKNKTKNVSEYKNQTTLNSLADFLSFKWLFSYWTVEGDWIEDDRPACCTDQGCDACSGGGNADYGDGSSSSDSSGSSSSGVSNAECYDGQQKITCSDDYTAHIVGCFNGKWDEGHDSSCFTPSENYCISNVKCETDVGCTTAIFKEYGTPCIQDDGSNGLCSGEDGDCKKPCGDGRGPCKNKDLWCGGPVINNVFSTDSKAKWICMSPCQRFDQDYNLYTKTCGYGVKYASKEKVSCSNRPDGWCDKGQRCTVEWWPRKNDPESGKFYKSGMKDWTCVNACTEMTSFDSTTGQIDSCGMRKDDIDLLNGLWIGTVSCSGNPQGKCSKGQICSKNQDTGTAFRCRGLCQYGVVLGSLGTSYGQCGYETDDLNLTEKLCGVLPKDCPQGTCQNKNNEVSDGRTTSGYNDPGFCWDSIT